MSSCEMTGLQLFFSRESMLGEEWLGAFVKIYGR